MIIYYLYVVPLFKYLLMIRTNCFGIITFSLLLACSLPSSGQNKKFPVTGTVVDAVTLQPLSDVNISIVGSYRGGTTNQAGEFTVTVMQFPAILYFSHVGYGIGSCQVEKSGDKNIRILLEPETKEIGEVTIRGEKISKVIQGDTLQIIDYEIRDDRIILFASPYRNLKDQRIYLANLNGDTLSHLVVRESGKQIKFPEIMMPQTEYLIRDFTGQVHYLDKTCAHEVSCTNDNLSLGYKTPYADFIGRVLPIKCEMEGKLIFQIATMTGNYTFYYGRGTPEGRPIKFVQDKKGPGRYVSAALEAYAPHDADFSKNVPVPVFRKGSELFVFDFFSDHIEVFDSDFRPVRKVPINFQNITVKDGLIFRKTSVDIDTKNFTQTILFDEKAGKAYAFFRLRSTNVQSLREINLETGKIDRTIEIPDYPNITHVQVHDNVVYFLYNTKTYPYYRLLYRMAI